MAANHVQEIAYVPPKSHPKIIGKGGATVKAIQNDCNVRIKIPNKEENSPQIVIIGARDNVDKAWKQMESALGAKMSHSPLVVAKFDIPKNQYGGIIGSGGATLRDLESKSGCTITMPPKDGASSIVEAEGPQSGIDSLVLELTKMLHGQLKIVGSEQHVVQSVVQKLDITSKPINEAIFFPEPSGNSTANFDRFLHYLRSARVSIDICVFTITDDRISNIIEDLFREGIKIRIITDNDTSLQEGSDIQKFKDVGIPVKMDKSAAHMHHKFAVLDNALLVNGSFNWTRQASLLNNENVMVTNNADFVIAFKNEFERMWKDSGRFN
mmetsp:Transcript_1415/g.1876  ORF Transcript_1415/g.1876 Transcript_1415/m.1876 type:complete len:325 (-) Transcript_1415:65-1039(-)|eukprot:CAMPEP_0168556264 /NCGR_PEP_ID=MMETSP0413-20121227/8784_1 /TAXON_ID=136452 /ORGANISM="Filamoeba nolandi, Strain NC-AS-23-1" /LENGTH=324 /DNA_ID=CAMNT_0008587187 /DNA_START=65 /DNA_END=1039 /DNA_ORIENTATION=+